jgi:hypothetical protein
MQMLQVLSQAKLHLQPMVIQRRMEVMNAGVAVVIDAVVVVGNVLSVAKVAQKRILR